MSTEVTRLKQTAPEEVSIETAIVSVISELESISSLNTEQRTIEKLFSLFPQPAEARV